MNNKEYFDNAADTWDDKFLTPQLFSFLDKLAPQFRIAAGQDVLDVGTGTGLLVPYLTRLVGPAGFVTAIDLSEKMVQKCQAKYSNIKNLSIKIADIEETVFQPATFDTVICFGVFPHIEHKENALHNISQMLKPRGNLIVAHALSSKELKEHHGKVSMHVAHSLLPGKIEMKNLLKRTGFENVYIKDEPGCYLCIAHKPSSG